MAEVTTRESEQVLKKKALGEFYVSFCDEEML